MMIASGSERKLRMTDNGDNRQWRMTDNGEWPALLPPQ